MFTKAFWTAALERAIRTFAQTMLALLGAAGLADVTTSTHFDWNGQAFLAMLGTAAFAAVLSILTSIVAGVNSGGNASLVPRSEATTPPQLVIDPDGDQPVL